MTLVFNWYFAHQNAEEILSYSSVVMRVAEALSYLTITCHYSLLTVYYLAFFRSQIYTVLPFITFTLVTHHSLIQMNQKYLSVFILYYIIFLLNIIYFWQSISQTN